jgi:serine/threonine protein phosphatase PrpC
MTLALRYAVRSDVGLLREGNEDSAYAGPHLLAVADGMGGHAAGEVASAATIATIAALDVDQPATDLLPALANAVASANTRLQEMIMSDPATEGMGTTLTALLWSDGHAALCHIGDSRAYLLRDGKFYQITHDHTLVQSLVDEGRITEDDVATHPQRSLLLRALDGRTIADPDLSTHETMPGDRYLICSDGLSGVVTEQTLHQALSSVRDPDKAALQLVELALKGGGPDNITCIVADVVDAQASGMPTLAPVMAGAASAGPPQQLRTATRPNSPAERARQLRQTKPQVAVPDDADDPRWAGAGSEAGEGDFGDRADITYHRIPITPPAAGSPYRRPAGRSDGTAPRNGAARHAARPAGPADDDDDAGWIRNRSAGRRRWPIVTSLLVVLVLALGIGGFVSYEWVQGKYYLGVQNDEVTIFQGINSSVAGISLSSAYQNTGLPLSQLSASDQGAIRATVEYGNLKAAQTVVTMLKTQADTCHTMWNQVVSWQQQDAAYQAALGHWAHLPPKQKSQSKQPTFTVLQPKTPDSGTCAPASAFGITARQLPPGTTNTTPTSSTSPATHPSATANPTPTTASPSASTSSKATTRPSATSSPSKR